MAITVEMHRGGATVAVADPQAFMAIVRDGKLRSDIQQIRSLREKAALAESIGKTQDAVAMKQQYQKIKSALPGFIFQCRAFEVHNWTDKKGVDHGDAAWRHQEYGVLNGLYMVDFDHIPDPRGLWQSLMEKGVLDRYKVLLAFVTSSNEGLKVVCVADENVGNLARNQAAFAEFAGVESDESCKDSSRLSFAPSFEDILFFVPELLTTENQAFAEKWQGRYADGSADQSLFGDGKKNKVASPAATTTVGGSSLNDKQKEVQQQLLAIYNEFGQRIINGEKLTLDEAHQQKTYDGIRLVDFISLFIGEKQPTEGKRSETLLKLAGALRYVDDDDQRDIIYYCYHLPFVQELVMQGRDVSKYFASAFKYDLNMNKPVKVREIIKKLQSQLTDGTCGDGGASDAAVLARLTDYGKQLAAMFDDFPCMREVCNNFGLPSFPSLVFTGGALFGTLATRTWYYFYHNPEQKRRLNYEIFIIADPTGSKSSVEALYKKILSPIIAADEVYDNQVNDYKKAKKNKDDKSKKDRDKTEIVYPTSRTRIHGSRTANNIFIEDMVNNVEEVDGEQLHLHLFTFDSELDNATVSSRGGQWIDKSIFELKAFHNEQDNQQYRNIDSYTGKFDVFWNFIYTGTPFSLNKKVTMKNFGSGLSTRLAVIPLASQKYHMIPLLKKSKDLEAVTDSLVDWAYKMDKVSGELPIWPLVEHCWQWVNDIMTVASETNDDVSALLCKRVPYYGIGIAVPYILMRHWDEWTKAKTLTIDDKDKALVTLVMEIQYYTQRLYFGKYAENYFNERKSDFKEKSLLGTDPQLLDLALRLPEKFKRQDAEKICSMGKTSVVSILNRLVLDGYIVRSGNARNVVYKKTDKLLKK